MPLSLFEEIKGADVGTDVTDILKVRYATDEDNERKSGKVDPEAKYKSMAQRNPNLFMKKPVRWLMKHKWGRRILFLLFGRKKDKPLSFPTHFPFIHKTDEERIENMPHLLGYKNPLIVTEKLDGTSSTYILERKGKKKFEFYVLSRNVRQRDVNQKCYHKNNIYWDMAIKYDIEKHLRDYLMENPSLTYVCVQGESVGSVQGNPLKLKEDDFYVFNFIRSDIGRINSIIGKDIIEKWGMKWVPILDTAYQMPATMEKVKQFADGKSKLNENADREGVVLRDPESDLSFKNVSTKYLLKHGG